MNLIFDLDGTLIDSKQRLYLLFQHLVTTSNLTYDEYWEMKQKKISNQEILSTYFSYAAADLSLFTTEWMLLIESNDFLKFDKVIDGVFDKLTNLNKASDLYVCTARQHERTTIQQLENLGLLKFFCKVLVTQQQHSKKKLIQDNLSNLSCDDWLIGDTGHDINTGKSLNIKTCAVKSGFLSGKVLSEYMPDVLLNNINDFDAQM